MHALDFEDRVRTPLESKPEEAWGEKEETLHTPSENRRFDFPIRNEWNFS
jgi:hypothetical protein